MSVSDLILLVVLSAVSYRVGRFIALDTLIDNPRARLLLWLGDRGAACRKIAELIGCAYCVTIWTSAGAVAITTLFVDVRFPVWVWLASATGALVFWSIIDSE
jgi:hypothetical protein